jgi:hypothetical protein
MLVPIDLITSPINGMKTYLTVMGQ